jgi:hypothetical protein
MLKRIEFIRDDRRSHERSVVGVVTDVSINLETSESRAISLFPAMRTKGATAFVIREADGPIVFRSHSAMPAAAPESIQQAAGRRAVPRANGTRLRRF